MSAQHLVSMTQDPILRDVVTQNNLLAKREAALAMVNQHVAASRVRTQRMSIQGVENVGPFNDAYDVVNGPDSQGAINGAT